MNHTKTGSGTDLACRPHLQTPDPDYYFFSTFFRFTLSYLNKFIWKGNFTSHQHHLTWIESDHENNIKKQTRDFPYGAVVKNTPANAGDTGLSPGLGRSHMPQTS